MSHLISFCMICKDEENVIERCLNSVKDIVDELIVVDTGSTDQTVNIAKKCGATVYHLPWNDDFAAARNFGLEKANGDWVLFLDADEQLHLEDGMKLRNLIQLSDDAAYFLKVLNFIGSTVEEGKIEECPVLRLFRNHQNVRFEGRVHEQIAGSIRKQFPDRLINYTDIRILHYGYQENVVADKKKKERNLKLVSRQVAEEPHNAFHRYNLAGEYMRTQNYQEALHQFQEAKKLCQIEQMAFGHLLIKKELICLAHLNKNKEALELSRQEIKRFPNYPDLYYLIGHFSLLFGNHEEAKQAFLQVVQTESPPCYAVDLNVTRLLAPFHLAKLYESEKNIDMATNYYIYTLQNNPDAESVLYRLCQLTITHAGEEKLMKLFEENQILRNLKNTENLIKILYRLDAYKIAYSLIKRLDKVLGEEAFMLRDMLGYLSGEATIDKQIWKIIDAVDLWIKGDIQGVSFLKETSENPVEYNFLNFIETFFWPDHVAPGPLDWQFIEFAFKAVKQVDDHVKGQHLIELWRYFTQIKENTREYHEGCLAYGLSIYTKAKLHFNIEKTNMVKISQDLSYSK